MLFQEVMNIVSEIQQNLGLPSNATPLCENLSKGYFQKTWPLAQSINSFFARRQTNAPFSARLRTAFSSCLYTTLCSPTKTSRQSMFSMHQNLRLPSNATPPCQNLSRGFTLFQKTSPLALSIHLQVQRTNAPFSARLRITFSGRLYTLSSATKTH